MTDVPIEQKFSICQSCGRQHDNLVAVCANCGWTPPAPAVETDVAETAAPDPANEA